MQQQRARSSGAAHRAFWQAVDLRDSSDADVCVFPVRFAARATVVKTQAALDPNVIVSDGLGFSSSLAGVDERGRSGRLGRSISANLSWLCMAPRELTRMHLSHAHLQIGGSTVALLSLGRFVFLP